MLSQHCPHPFHQAHTPGGLWKGKKQNSCVSTFIFVLPRTGWAKEIPLSCRPAYICVVLFPLQLFFLFYFNPAERYPFHTDPRTLVFSFFPSFVLYLFLPRREISLSHRPACTCVSACFYVCATWFHVCASHMHTLPSAHSIPPPALVFLFDTPFVVLAR